jgi:hypothetical protein
VIVVVVVVVVLVIGERKRGDWGSGEVGTWDTGVGGGRG